MYMGHEEDEYLYPAFGKWYFYDELGDSIGPFQDFVEALGIWQKYVRCEIEKHPNFLDRLEAWWYGGK